MDPDNQLVKVGAELAEHLGISLTHLSSLVESGELGPVVRMGDRVRCVYVRGIGEFITRNTENPAVDAELNEIATAITTARAERGAPIGDPEQ